MFKMEKMKLQTCFVSTSFKTCKMWVWVVIILTLSWSVNGVQDVDPPPYKPAAPLTPALTPTVPSNR